VVVATPLCQHPWLALYPVLNYDVLVHYLGCILTVQLDTTCACSSTEMVSAAVLLCRRESTMGGCPLWMVCMHHSIHTVAVC
jgi:hypothetical protein